MDDRMKDVTNRLLKQTYTAFVEHVERARKGKLAGTREERGLTIYQSDVFLGDKAKELG